MIKENIKKKSNKLEIILGIIFFIIFVISMFYVILYFYNKNESKNIGQKILDKITIDETKITNTKSEKMLKLEELQKENSDIIGWLQIEDTQINYPVLKTDNNNFYLNHDYKKENSAGGALFLDKDFDMNLPSSNYLIYGHRMKNGSMFEDLIKYKDKNFYKEHQNIIFTTNKEDEKYEIIAAFYSRVYLKFEKDVFRYYYFINASDENEYDTYVKNCKNASIYDTEKTAKYGDQLMTLSTCSYHTEDGRFAVVAKKIK